MSRKTAPESTNGRITQVNAFRWSYLAMFRKGPANNVCRNQGHISHDSCFFLWKLIRVDSSHWQEIIYALSETLTWWDKLYGAVKSLPTTLLYLWCHNDVDIFWFSVKFFEQLLDGLSYNLIRTGQTPPIKISQHPQKGFPACFPSRCNLPTLVVPSLFFHCTGARSSYV